MFGTLKTLLRGSAARAEQDLVDRNAALLLEQKVRESEAGHDAAKRALAAIIVGRRTEDRGLDVLKGRIADLEARTRSALDAGDEELALEAAKILAELENEKLIREQNIARADQAAERLRLAVEKTQRRITDLRQGLLTARAMEHEQRANRGLRGDLNGSAALKEGEELLKRILERTDPVQEMDVFDELEADLSGEEIVNRLADAGHGKHTRVQAHDVIERLKAGAQVSAPAAS